MCKDTVLGPGVFQTTNRRDTRQHTGDMGQGNTTEGERAAGGPQGHVTLSRQASLRQEGHRRAWRDGARHQFTATAEVDTAIHLSVHTQVPEMRKLGGDRG